MGSHSFTGGPSHPTRSLRYSESDYYVIANGRSGQPNSSRLSPVHVWWLSQALSSRATTVIAGLVPTIANCNRKCGSSRVLLAKTHCVKQGRGGPRRLSRAGMGVGCHPMGTPASSWNCGVFLCTWLCVFAPQTGFMRGAGGRWPPSASKVKTPPP